MKKIAMILLAVGAITFSASAQEKKEMKGKHDGMHRHHGKHKQHGMHNMAKQLNFSDDQKKQAKAYNDDLRAKMKDLNSKENITVKEQRDQKAALLKDHRAKMQGLLTSEQKTKMAQLKEDQKKKSEEHFAKHLDKMKTTLGLSDAQVNQLRSQREAMHSKFKSIRENGSLSREEKKTQLMALKEEAKAAHKKIFTAEQMKKMEEMKKKHFNKEESKK